MKMLILIILFGLFSHKPQEVDPTFEAVKGGWQAQCPAQMEMVRKDVQPYCDWGLPLMTHKPTQDQFKCMPVKKARKHLHCPIDQYYLPEFGAH